MLGSNGSRVLIVEDDEGVRGFLGRALERGGYEPIGVRTGEEAMREVRARPGVVLALIDGLLPDMHGVRLADQILDDDAGAGVAICFVSGAIREPRDTGAGVAALSKPVRLREFLDTVDALVAWRQGGSTAVAERRAALRELEHGFLVGP